jgi:nucleolar protein 56
MDIQEFKTVREKCIRLTKQRVKESVNQDTLITQAISSIEELDVIINKVVTRVREWYSWYNPEFSKKIGNPEKFIELIVKKDKATLLKEINVHESMGKDLEKHDLDAILALAREADALVKTRDREKQYLEECLKKSCPNLLEVVGSTLAAKLIRHLGSIQRMAMTPAPVIQIVGAEKALFRHLAKDSRSPKYGLIFAHPLISNVGGKGRGKMARAIGDKAAIAVRIDFFKGKFIGDKLREDLEKKAALLRKV